MSDQQRVSFTQEDKVCHSGLIQLLNNGEFKLQAKDIAAFQKVCQWVNGLPQKFEQQASDPVSPVAESKDPKK